MPSRGSMKKKENVILRNEGVDYRQKNPLKYHLLPLEKGFMNILFIGHSLIEFFDWQKRFPAHRVSNLGVAGETAEGLLSRTDAITKAHPHADLIFIMTGLNNIAMDDFDFFDPCKRIIEKLRAAYPSSRIFVNSLLPVIVEFINNATIQTANKSLKELSTETGAGFLDIYGLYVDEKGRVTRDYFLDDGVHLSNKGYAVWSTAIEKIIKQAKE